MKTAGVLDTNVEIYLWKAAQNAADPVAQFKKLLDSLFVQGIG
jgi:hypothetical protein